MHLLQNKKKCPKSLVILGCMLYWEFVAAESGTSSFKQDLREHRWEKHEHDYRLPGGREGMWSLGITRSIYCWYYPQMAKYFIGNGSSREPELRQKRPHDCH